MSKYPEQLSLKEKYEEDHYFAKRDRELIKALREKRLSQALELKSKKHQKAAREFEQHFEQASQAYSKKPRKRLQSYSKILKKILKLFPIKRKEKS